MENVGAEYFYIPIESTIPFQDNWVPSQKTNSHFSIRRWSNKKEYSNRFLQIKDILIRLLFRERHIDTLPVVIGLTLNFYATEKSADVDFPNYLQKRYGFESPESLNASVFEKKNNNIGNRPIQRN